MFGALKRGFRSMASLILVRNVVGELQPKRTLAASRGFLAAARLSCINNDRPELGALPNTLHLFKFLNHQRFSLVKNNNRHL